MGGARLRMSKRERERRERERLGVKGWVRNEKKGKEEKDELYLVYLLNKRSCVSEHWLKERESFFISCPSTGHAQCHG